MVSGGEAGRTLGNEIALFTGKSRLLRSGHVFACFPPGAAMPARKALVSHLFRPTVMYRYVLASGFRIRRLKEKNVSAVVA